MSDKKDPKRDVPDRFDDLLFYSAGAFLIIVALALIVGVASYAYQATNAIILIMHTPAPITTPTTGTNK